MQLCLLAVQQDAQHGKTPLFKNEFKKNVDGFTVRLNQSIHTRGYTVHVLATRK